MANSYIDFVKEWRKSNPNVSYKDALKQASADYKKQKSTSVSGGSKKAEPKKAEPKEKKETKTRTKDIRLYKMYVGSIEKKLSNKIELDTEEYDGFRKLANLLRGKSQTNQYAKKLKEFDRKLKSKKYAKLSAKIAEEDKQLQIKIKDKKSKPITTSIDKTNVVFESGVRKTDRQEKRRRQLQKLTDGKGNKKYDAKQIDRIIELEDLGLTARELKETTTALGKYLPDDFLKEFRRINPSFSGPIGMVNARAYIAINRLFKTNPYEVPIITDKDVIRDAKKTNAFTTAPTIVPPLPIVATPSTTNLGVKKLTKIQQKNYDAIVDKFGLNDVDRDLSNADIFDEFYNTDKLTTKTKVDTLIRQVDTLQKKYGSGKTSDRLIDISATLKDYLDEIDKIKEAKKIARKSSKTTDDDDALPTVFKTAEEQAEEDKKAKDALIAKKLKIKKTAEDKAKKSKSTKKTKPIVAKKVLTKEEEDEIDQKLLDIEMEKSPLMNKILALNFSIRKRVFNKLADDGFEYDDVDEESREKIARELGLENEVEQVKKWEKDQANLIEEEAILKEQLPEADVVSGEGFADLIQRGMGRNNNIMRVDSVENEDKKYAEIANAVYYPPQSRQKLILGYRLMDTKEFNQDRRVVYGKSNDDIIIAYRGTTDGRDLQTDLKLAMGNLKSTFRFKKDLDWTHNLIAGLKPNKVVFTGHSLGGTIAIEMTDTFRGNTRAVVFNAGQGIKMGNRNHLNVKFYSVKGDLVSMLGTGAYKDVRILTNEKTRKNKTPKSAHSTSNFDVENEANYIDDEEPNKIEKEPIKMDEEPIKMDEDTSGGGLYSNMKSGLHSVKSNINARNFKDATKHLNIVAKLNENMPESYKIPMLNEINAIRQILVG